MLKSSLPAATLLSITLLISSSCSKSEKAQPKTNAPEAVETSTEVSLQEPVADNIQYIKWTPELNVPDPVSISFDDRGRAYVTQTQRRRANDLDIRGQRDWIPDDVSFTSVEDKKVILKIWNFYG